MIDKQTEKFIFNSTFEIDMKKYSIAIHGGAGTIDAALLTTEKEAAYHNGLSDALEAGQEILKQNGNALDAVEAAVMSLENNILFNAGRGAVFNHNGTHEMDAAIMSGIDLRAGAVCSINGVRNPVQLARAVMEKTEHVLLCGSGAENFAREIKMQFEKDDYFFSQQRFNDWQAIKDSEKMELDHHVPGAKTGTVGAVAMDTNGNLAAATSTGGMTNKKWGRVGDTPIIGAGTYANNIACAVSCTGHGEYFLRNVVAYDVFALMHYKGLLLREACEEVVKRKLNVNAGEGGLIAIDKLGNIEMCFNSTGMYRAAVNHKGEKTVAIYR